MATIYETLQSRWHFDGIAGFSGPAKAAFEKALDVGMALQTKRSEIGTDNKLTRAGHLDKFREHLGKNAHELARLSKTADKLQANIAQRRAAIQPKSPDPANLSAAVARSDLRSMLRTMPIGQRMQLALAPDADQTLLDAILELPNYASGINDQTRQLVTATVIERQNPGALATIEKMQGAVTMVETATRVAFDAAKDSGEFANWEVLNEFINTSVGDTSRLDADIDRVIEAA